MSDDDDDDDDDVDDEQHDFRDGLQSGDEIYEDQQQEQDEHAAGWGSSKRDYYDNDEVITQEEAKAEVEEAIRLQMKKLAKLKPADFGLDEVEWLDGGKEGDTNTFKAGANEAKGVVSEVLQPWVPTPDMGAEDHAKILRSWYPEFDYLAQEITELVPLLQSMESQATDSPNDIVPTAGRSTSAVKAKCRALAAYTSTITMYFALLASGEGRAMDPDDLHTHEVMDCLVQTRETWLKVKGLEDRIVDLGDGIDLSLQNKDISESSKRPLDDDKDSEHGRPAKKARKETAASMTPTKRAQKEVAEANAAAEKLARQQQETEASLASLSQLLPASKSRSKITAQPKPTAKVESDNNSDFGEESHLTTASAAEKAKRKKSLRFYTSQIVQKSSKRQDAGRDAGGDTDLPYRERLRDREARLNAEAEKRGKKLDSYGRGKGVDLGDEQDEQEDAQMDRQSREYGEDDEYYDLVTNRSKIRKLEKEANATAMAGTKSSNPNGYPKEDAEGKRAIGYTIEKNKGLAPKRKKEVRNPRVKKRMKFEEKKKKLGSMKAVYKGGEGRGGYGGEKTGIKSNLVKSVKL